MYIFFTKLNKKIQFYNSIINSFPVYKLTFFRWIKYIYISEYDVNRFTLFPVRREFLKKLSVS